MTVPIDLVDDRYPCARRIVQAVPHPQMGVDVGHVVAQVGGHPILYRPLWVGPPHILNAHGTDLFALGADVGQRQWRSHPDIRRPLGVKGKGHELRRPRRRLRHPPVCAHLAIAGADDGGEAGGQGSHAAVKVARPHHLHGASLKWDPHIKGAGVEAGVARQVVGALKGCQRHCL